MRECIHDGKTPLYARDSRSCPCIGVVLLPRFLFLRRLLFAENRFRKSDSTHFSTYYAARMYAYRYTYAKKTTRTFVEVVYMLIREYEWDEGGPVSITWSRRPLRYLPSPSSPSTTFPPYHSEYKRNTKEERTREEKKEREIGETRDWWPSNEATIRSFSRKKKKTQNTRAKEMNWRNGLSTCTTVFWINESPDIFSHNCGKKKCTASESVKRACHVNSLFPVFRYSSNTNNQCYGLNKHTFSHVLSVQKRSQIQVVNWNQLIVIKLYSNYTV